MSGKPAATIGSMHTCPMVSGTTPHVGGPITQGEPNILHNSKPAATMNSMCTCVGPPDTIVQGHPAIFHNGKPAACMGDMTAHGGIITTGEPNIIHGFVTEPMAPVTMPVSKIPFPEFSLLNTLLGNASEAQANQQALQEEEEGEPRVYNLQWVKEDRVTRGEKVLKQVTLRASVDNIPDGQNATIKVKVPVEVTDDQGNTTIDKENKVELTGVVQDKMVEVVWEIEEKNNSV